MAVVAMTSVKGAPGVTTAALALTSAWPVHRRAVLVEADPAGGDIAARFGISPDPGLASLATGLRHEHSSGVGGTLTQHAQELSGGVRLLVEPVSRTEARSALDIVADSLPGLAEAEGVDLIVDCGRLVTGDHVSPILESGTRTTVSPVARLLMHADLVLLLTVGELADLSHVQTLLPLLQTRHVGLSILVRSPQVWTDEEIERELEVEVVGGLPFDAVSADVLAGRQHSRRAARLPLFRAATAIADRVVSQLEGAAGHVAGHTVDASSGTPLLTTEVAGP
jgi:hypothetical protein